MLVKHASLQELSEITLLEQAIFKHTYTRDFFETFRESKSVLVAKRDDKIVGIVGWFEQGEIAEIIMVGVDAQYRNQSIGTLLMKACLSQLMNQSIKSVFVEVRESNKVARKLYESFGFELNRIRESYYQHPTENALEMRLTL